MDEVEVVVKDAPGEVAVAVAVSVVAMAVGVKLHPPWDTMLWKGRMWPRAHR